MEIEILTKRQENLTWHQSNDVLIDVIITSCGAPIDTSLMLKTLNVYDIYGNLVFTNNFFGATAAQLSALRTTLYRYTYTVAGYTYFFGFINILPI